MAVLDRRTWILSGLLSLAALSGARAEWNGPSDDGPPGGGPPPWARGRGRRRRHRDDHDCALRALAEGRAKPLSQILPGVEKELGGQAIDVELEHCKGRVVYEIKLLRPDGRLIEVVVDAMTGRPIEDGKKSHGDEL
ncbi:membrane protein [Rhodovulum sp. PH10]|uniref:PepSY domain-containing protein n=1 Tax=Rhodovulum sp. PH10 TaxID=1187851 RepID=UPI00027C287C|nr:PepSY domain-containing protein [Rhodovulum sp. PH10]EJW13485.1 membrane protein [Rhodovulum sp. PH10]